MCFFNFTRFSSCFWCWFWEAIMILVALVVEALVGSFLCPQCSEISQWCIKLVFICGSGHSVDSFNLEMRVLQFWIMFLRLSLLCVLVLFLELSFGCWTFWTSCPIFKFCFYFSSLNILFHFLNFPHLYIPVLLLSFHFLVSCSYFMMPYLIPFSKYWVVFLFSLHSLFILRCFFVIFGLSFPQISGNPWLSALKNGELKS